MNVVWTFLKSLPSPVQLILVGVLVFGVTLTLSNFNQKTEIASYIEKYKVFQAETKKTVKMLDSVKTANMIKEAEILLYMKEANVFRAEAERLAATLPSPKVVADLKTKIDSLKAATVDSVVLARTVIPAQDELIKTHEATIGTQKLSMLAKDNENIALRKTIIVQDGEIDSLNWALDSARTNLVNVPKPPKDPDKIFFGLIPKPTRTQAVIGGFVGGILTYAVVTK